MITQTVRVDFRSGLQPVGRAVTPASDPLVSVLLFILLAATLFDLRHTRRLFATFGSDITGSRSRQNIFDETTAYENRSLAILSMLFCMVGAMVLYLLPAGNAVVAATSFGKLNAAMFALGGLCMAWYLAHLLGYSLIGWTFGEPESTKVWIRVFNLSMAVFTLVSVLPVAAAIYIPDTRVAMVPAILIIFAVTLSIPVIKGFRIFYDNIFSILYFILYLCTLEIIPLISVYAAARYVIGLL